MTRARKRDVDKARLVRDWSRQARAVDFSAKAVVSKAKRSAARTRSSLSQGDLFANPDFTATQTAQWAVDHLSERQSVFKYNELLTAVLARDPGAVTVLRLPRVVLVGEEVEKFQLVTVVLRRIERISVRYRWRQPGPIPGPREIPWEMRQEHAAASWENPTGGVQCRCRFGPM